MPGTGMYDHPMQVRPGSDLIDLVPGYLGRREADVVAIESALSEGDLPRVQALGHSMKGSGGGYGFDGITEIGLRLENAGRAGDGVTARIALDDLRAYLRNVEVLDV